jgi:hypothetical protein
MPVERERDKIEKVCKVYVLSPIENERLYTNANRIGK